VVDSEARRGSFSRAGRWPLPIPGAARSSERLSLVPEPRSRSWIRSRAWPWAWPWACPRSPAP